MKYFLVVDSENIVRCCSTEWHNLHTNWLEDKNSNIVAVEDFAGRCGDEYDPGTGSLKIRPENYPKPSTDDLIAAEIEHIRKQRDRAQAIQNLKQRGDLPANYTERAT